MFGVVAIFGLALGPLADSGGGFLLALSVVHVAHVYEEYWPVGYEPVPAVAWTVSVSVVVGCLFVGVFWALGGLLGPTVAAATALVSAIGFQYTVVSLGRRA